VRIRPAREAVTTAPVVAAMWRGLEVLRPLAVLYAVWNGVQHHHQWVRPGLAWAVLAVLVAWTVAVGVARHRTPLLLGVELALASAAVLLTRLVDPAEVIEGGAKTLPGIWPAAAVVGWALLKGWRGGLAAGAVVSIADLIEVQHPTEHTFNNIVLLFLVGGCIGYCADLARMGHEALTEAMRLQAQTRERDRLARTIHDGVLQTLAFIHRRGQQLGGATGELGAMAADQEQLLRALVSGVPTDELDDVVGGRADLRGLLSRHAGGMVSVIPPADPVWLPRRVADEVSAAVQAALENVRLHAGQGANAWVLIEDEGGGVRVTIRDDGVGLPEGRLAAAAAGGRMGVAGSIRGRMADLGGTAHYRSGPGAGTTVELCVPREGRP
jgi:signal transduction histidine kinase